MWPFGKKSEKNADELKEQAQMDAQAERDIAEAANEEDKRKYKRRRMMSRFKLDKHHKMERFMMIFTASSIILLSTAGYGVYNAVVASNESQATTSLLTQMSQFSLSGEELRVGRFIANPDKTRVMIPLRANSMDNLSTNAENYQVFISNGRKDVNEIPDVKLHVFGSSGLLALEVTSTNNQPLYNEEVWFIIRNNYDLADKQQSADPDELPDPSFGVNDQISIFANPGAKDVETSNKMNETLSVNDMYYLLDGYERENEILRSIDELMITMRDDLLRGEEYANRIKELGFVPPEAPDYFKDDEITLDEEAMEAENGEVNEEGELVYEDVITDSFYQPKATLKTDHLVPGAFDIRWQGRTTREGFVDQLVDNPIDLGRYLRQKDAEKERNEEKIEQVEFIERQDGVELPLSDLGNQDATADEQEVLRYLTDLQQVWSSYLTKKTQLQIDKVKELVLLDAEVKTQSQGYSSVSIHDDNGSDYIIKLNE